MAEGDSIARLARRLDAAAAGRIVRRSRFRHPRVATADLTGARISGWHSYGKHLLMRLDDGRTLHSHLRMSGRWSILRAGRRPPPHLDVRALLVLDDDRTLAGVALPVLHLVTDERTVLGHLGPDLIGATFDPMAAVLRLRRPGAALVAALLDQRRVAGLGNMWAGELCFLHGLSPWAPVERIAADQLHGLLDDARARLHNAVTDNPRQLTTGDRRTPHWVYRRANRPCLRCTTRVAFRPARSTPHGRETWWCPGCQAPA